ncbi:MAG TPA: hypothetical protein DF712_14100 [Balneola sp.]|nr:hypothetical protein [Balneola sp.]
MTDIPIWPGSSSFGEQTNPTPFGFFDTDNEFTSSADKAADFCARRMGYPISDIELQDINFYACFEEATSEYGNQVNLFNIKDHLLELKGAPTSSNLSGKIIRDNQGYIINIAENYGVEAGVGGDVTYHTGSIAVTSSVQRYDINTLFRDTHEAGEEIEIKRVFHNPTPAITRYFDPFVGTGLGSQNMLENFGWGNYSPGVSFMLMPVYADLLRLQAIEFNDQIRRSQYSFNIINNELSVFPLPTENYTLYFEYIKKSDRSNPIGKVGTTSTSGMITDMSNVPYNKIEFNKINDVGRQWIFKYTLALAKEMLGNIRSKYSSIPIPNADVTLNGADLLSQSAEEKSQLMDKLHEHLDQMSKRNLLEKKKEESEFLQEQLNKNPLKIYIG